MVDAAASCGRPAIVGLAKNAGKTTVLNFLVSEFARRGLHPGIASIGRDGEHTDLITLKKKPLIFLPPGCCCVTASRLAPEGFILLEELEGRGVLGKPGVYRNPREAAAAVQVELAGVNRIEAMSRALGIMTAYAGPLLVDGALDRRSQGNPLLSDGVILSTGATVGNSIDLVCKKTLEQLDLIGLKEPEFSASVLEVSGALTDRKALHIEKRGFTGCLLVNDWTKIFLTAAVRRRLGLRGVSISVRYPARLIGLTVNPHNPRGRDLPADELRSHLTAAIKNRGWSIPCVDVKNSP